MFNTCILKRISQLGDIPIRVVNAERGVLAVQQFMDDETQILQKHLVADHCVIRNVGKDNYTLGADTGS